MLNSNADRKRLGFQVDGAIVQRIKSISSAVAHCEDDPFCSEIAAVLKMQSTEMSISSELCNVEIDNVMLEPIFPAEALDLSTQIFDDLDQAECADVRMCFDQDLRGSACGDKFGENLSSEMPGILDLTPEFSI